MAKPKCVINAAHWRRAVALLAAWFVVVAARAENWNQFRGTGVNGDALDAQLPDSWAPDQQIRWKVSLPGVGWSQPVVWDERIFVTTAESDALAKPDPKNTGPGIGGFASLLSGGRFSLAPPNVTYRWKVLCLDAASGEVLWEKVAHEGRPRARIHANNTYASETPATDGERVFALFGMTGLYCYDVSGAPLWSRDLGAFPTQYGWGTGSSPILDDERVYLQCDNDEASFLVALDKKSGNDVWRVDREEETNWSTPYLWRNKLRTELITAGGNQMRSYNPKSGELLWSMKGSGRTGSTPVGSDELLYVDSYDRLTGGSGLFAAIRPGASGDISLQEAQTSNAHVAWSTRMKGQRIASPIFIQDCLYIFEQNAGIVRCLDAKTGEEHFRERVPGTTGFVSSPLACRRKLYCVDKNCATVVIEPGPELKVIATSNLDEMCWASPAVAGNHLLIRTVDHLYSIGPK